MNTYLSPVDEFTQGFAGGAALGQRMYQPYIADMYRLAELQRMKQAEDWRRRATEREAAARAKGEDWRQQLAERQLAMKEQLTLKDRQDAWDTAFTQRVWDMLYQPEVRNVPDPNNPGKTIPTLTGGYELRDKGKNFADAVEEAKRQALLLMPPRPGGGEPVVPLPPTVPPTVPPTSDHENKERTPLVTGEESIPKDILRNTPAGAIGNALWRGASWLWNAALDAADAYNRRFLRYWRGEPPPPKPQPSPVPSMPQPPQKSQVPESNPRTLLDTILYPGSQRETLSDILLGYFPSAAHALRGSPPTNAAEYQPVPSNVNRYVQLFPLTEKFAPPPPEPKPLPMPSESDYYQHLRGLEKMMYPVYLSQGQPKNPVKEFFNRWSIIPFFTSTTSLDDLMHSPLHERRRIEMFNPQRTRRHPLDLSEYEDIE